MLQEGGDAKLLLWFPVSIQRKLKKLINSLKAWAQRVFSLRHRVIRFVFKEKNETIYNILLALSKRMSLGYLCNTEIFEINTRL